MDISTLLMFVTLYFLGLFVIITIFELWDNFVTGITMIIYLLPPLSIVVVFSALTGLPYKICSESVAPYLRRKFMRSKQNDDWCDF